MHARFDTRVVAFPHVCRRKAVRVARHIWVDTLYGSNAFNQAKSHQTLMQDSLLKTSCANSECSRCARESRNCCFEPDLVRDCIYTMLAAPHTLAASATRYMVEAARRAPSHGETICIVCVWR